MIAHAHNVYDSYKRPPTLAEHFWILSRLLAMKYGAAQVSLLRTYVIATCYRKMYRRFKHKTLSLPYISTLESVNMAGIDFNSQEKQNIAFESQEKQELQDANDRKFLVDFLITYSEDQPSKLRFTNLLEQARLAAQHKPFQLYNESTYREFHGLLLQLLDDFRDGLLALQKSADKTMRSIQDENDSDNILFGDYLNLVDLIGYGLQKLTRGSALHMHLRTINSSLQEHRRRLDISTSSEEEQDEELKAVQPQALRIVTDQPQQQVALHESYVEWLKLILIHFDSADILGRYINGPQFQWNTVNVRILNAPPVSNDMLDWRELFTDPKFSTIWGSASDPSFTQEKILEFLDNVANSNLEVSVSLAKTIRALLKAPAVGRNPIQIQSEVRRLMQTTVPGWIENAAELHAHDLPSLSTDEVRRASANAIDSLLSSSNLTFFQTLSNFNISGFGGSMHCEAILASLLNHSKGGTIDGMYEDIRAQLRVGYSTISNMLSESSDPFFFP